MAGNFILGGEIMRDTLVDAPALNQDLEMRLLWAANTIGAEKLPAELRDILSMREGIRNHVLAQCGVKQGSFSVEYLAPETLGNADLWISRYFAKMAELQIEKLPQEMVAILELMGVVRVNTFEANEFFHQSSHPMIRPPALSAGVEEGVDVRFELHKARLQELWMKIADENGRGSLSTKTTKTRQWKMNMKFGPFAELARVTKITAEEWMDNPLARKLCASLLCSHFHVSPAGAKTFYGHVAKELRELEHSMWQEYKLMRLQDMDDSEE